MDEHCVEFKEHRGVLEWVAALIKSDIVFRDKNIIISSESNVYLISMHLTNIHPPHPICNPKESKSSCQIKNRVEPSEEEKGIVST